MSRGSKNANQIVEIEKRVAAVEQNTVDETALIAFSESVRDKMDGMAFAERRSMIEQLNIRVVQPGEYPGMVGLSLYGKIELAEVRFDHVSPG